VSSTQRKGRSRRDAPPGARARWRTRITRASDWLARQDPIERLELIRILIPLAILGFMSSRLVHADQWLSDVGFTVPDLGEPDWRQPLYIPPVPEWLAWLIGAGMVISGLLLAVGFKTRMAAAAFVLSLVYVALADRLAAFTVSKVAPLLAIALLLSPCGARYSVDSWLASRKHPGARLPTRVAGGCVRFLQVFLVVFYFSSAVCKMRGDWLEQPVLLWTQLHDSYQTPMQSRPRERRACMGLDNATGIDAWVRGTCAVLVRHQLDAPVCPGLRDHHARDDRADVRPRDLVLAAHVVLIGGVLRAGTVALYASEPTLPSSRRFARSVSVRLV